MKGSTCRSAAYSMPCSCHLIHHANPSPKLGFSCKGGIVSMASTPTLSITLVVYKFERIVSLSLHTRITSFTAIG